MRHFVYALLDSCSDELVTLAWSIHGAAKIAVVENRDLVFEDGSFVSLEELEARLIGSNVVEFYVPGDGCPVGRIERRRIEA